VAGEGRVSDIARNGSTRAEQDVGITTNCPDERGQLDDKDDAVKRGRRSDVPGPSG
jgi:hypothetical protein